MEIKEGKFTESKSELSNLNLLKTLQTADSMMTSHLFVAIINAKENLLIKSFEFKDSYLYLTTYVSQEPDLFYVEHPMVFNFVMLAVTGVPKISFDFCLKPIKGELVATKCDNDSDAVVPLTMTFRFEVELATVSKPT